MKKIVAFLITVSCILSSSLSIGANKYVNVDIKNYNHNFFIPHVTDCTDKKYARYERLRLLRKKTNYNKYNDITLNTFKEGYLDQKLLDGYSYNSPEPIVLTTRESPKIRSLLEDKVSWIIPNYPGKRYLGNDTRNGKYMFGKNYHIMFLRMSMCTEFLNLDDFTKFFKTVNNLDYILLYFSETQNNYLSIQVFFTEGNITQISDVVSKLKEENRISYIMFADQLLPEYLNSDLYQQYLYRPID